MYCPKCGTKLPESSQLCPQCAQTPKPLEASAVVAPTTAAPAEATPGAEQIPPDVKISSHLGDSILVTICCCMPFGIVGIIYAARVSALIQAGNYEEAKRSAKLAQRWNIWGAILGIILTILWTAIQFLAAASTDMDV